MFIISMESPLDQMARLWFGGLRSERLKAFDKKAFCKTPVQEDQRQFELRSRKLKRSDPEAWDWWTEEIKE